MSLLPQILVFFIASIILSPLMIALVKWIAHKYSLLDRPHLYKSEAGRKPAPYSVGIVVFLTLLALSPLIYLFGDFSPLLEKRFTIVLVIGALISLISWIDDMDTIGKSPVKVPPLVRLGMQILVGLIIGLTSIKIAYVSNIFGGILPIDSVFFQFMLAGNTIEVYPFPLMITVFWYVLIFNAVNFSDGVPGITGGFAFITFCILGILAVKLYLTDTTVASQENSRFILTIIAILLPITFFLTRADISRQVIMGDTGTIMLAFLIATLAIIAGGKIATTISVLGIYLIDLIYVVISRIRRGQNPMKGDQDSHLHFRLLEIGLSKSQVRLVIYFLATVFGLSAIFLSTHGKILLFVVITGITVFLTEILETVRTHKGEKERKLKK